MIHLPAPLPSCLPFFHQPRGDYQFFTESDVTSMRLLEEFVFSVSFPDCFKFFFLIYSFHIFIVCLIV